MLAFGWPFAVSGIAYLTLGLWIFLRRKSSIHLLYGVLCIATCLWQVIWAILFTQPWQNGTYNWLRFCYSGIVMIPAVFYHFIIQVTDSKPERPFILPIYLLCVVFTILVWSGNVFLNGFVEFPWGIAAKAGPFHMVFGLVVASVIGRVFVLFCRLNRLSSLSEAKRSQNRWIKIAAFMYCGGAIDIFSNYGVPIFPVSFIFLTASILLFGYAILRQNLLTSSILLESVESQNRRAAVTNEMGRLGMTAAFPLVSQGEVLGYLLLGEKMSEETYNIEDLRLLRIVANQAALGYQRVRYLEMAVHGARTEMLGEIAGGFAHEIKTPLANISLPAELSIMDIADVEKGQKKFEDILPELKVRLRDIMQQTFKASEKIEAIRQFSKPGQVQLAVVDLATVFQNSLGLLDHLLRKSGTKVRAEFPQVMSYIRGDAKQIEIVFVNLIKNAAEAMTQHTSSGLAREIWLKGYEEGNWVVVSVKDTGPGIKRTEIAHLFEAYFTTKGSAGTGMGLFLSRQVIKAHGGSIDVRSEEGKGTEFLIRLPKYAAEKNPGVHEAA